MSMITINGRACEFEPGQVILQVALDNEIDLPHYCYHPGLSIVANCRICLAEVWAPNPRNDNRLDYGTLCLSQPADPTLLVLRGACGPEAGLARSRHRPVWARFMLWGR